MIPSKRKTFFVSSKPGINEKGPVLYIRKSPDCRWRAGHMGVSENRQHPGFNCRVCNLYAFAKKVLMSEC